MSAAPRLDFAPVLEASLRARLRADLPHLADDDPLVGRLAELCLRAMRESWFTTRLERMGEPG